MQKNKHKKWRLIVDVNAWISSLLSPGFNDRLAIVFSSRYQLMVSEQLLRELDRTVHKPHLAKRIGQANYESLVSQLRVRAELVEVLSVVDACRDPKDNYLLALAKDGDADYLITGDLDLLTMEQFEKTKIVKLSDFVELV